jgi:hypothetical protein
MEALMKGRSARFVKLFAANLQRETDLTAEAQRSQRC